MATKKSTVSMPSKAQMAKEDRRYRAESMVRDSMMNAPQFKKACRVAERELAKAETTVKNTVLKKK